MSRTLFALAAGLTGLIFGAGIGIAAGEDPGATATPPPITAGAFESMDEMHAAMRGQMPDDLRAQCDAMHASMPQDLRAASPGAMGSMGSMMGDGRPAGDMADQHAAHHG